MSGWGGPERARLPDGRRLHFHHGPIDLILEAFGPGREVALAYTQAWARFADVLPELVSELAPLRRPLAGPPPRFRGAVARRMLDACRPHGETFVTPMAAVAGAVADEVLAAMNDGRALRRAYVNNGGDIALHLAPGERFETGIVTRLQRPGIEGVAGIAAAAKVRGIATSGWRGRSFSLGIADAVTVLARSAAEADVAATLVANAVDVADGTIERLPATELDADSDLGDRLVTVAVGELDEGRVAQALGSGVLRAEAMRRAGLLRGAMLALRGEVRVIGDLALSETIDPVPSAREGWAPTSLQDVGFSVAAS